MAAGPPVRSPLILFGFGLTLLSGFGQTFFVGIFGADLRNAAQIGDGAFGAIYSAATLAGGVLIYWAGAAVDRISLRTYAAAAVLALGAGCSLIASTSSAAWLVAALFLVRFAGQGLLPHAAVTSVARAFEHGRGKAISLTLLGHPAGEAVLPSLAIVVISLSSWDAVWLNAAVLLFMISALIMFLGAPGVLHSQATRSGQTVSFSWTRKEVLKDTRFYLLVPTLMLPAFIITGIFIHQSRLIEEKGWELSWFAVNLTVFAGAQVAGMLGAGAFIDRFSARRLVRFYLLPLGIACALMSVIDDSLVVSAFMVGAGITNGASASTVTAIWAEMYGVANLGAIRALSTSMMVLATAVAPALFGFLLEWEFSMSWILAACVGFVAISCALSFNAGRASHQRAR